MNRGMNLVNLELAYEPPPGLQPFSRVGHGHGHDKVTASTVDHADSTAGTTRLPSLLCTQCEMNTIILVGMSSRAGVFYPLPLRPGHQKNLPPVTVTATVAF